MTHEELERLAKLTADLPKCHAAFVFVDKNEARLRIKDSTWVLPKKMLASLREIDQQ